MPSYLAPQPAPIQIIAPIVAVQSVAPRHFLFSLHSPEIAQRARAGQFVHVLPRDSASSDPFLRRAFSIMAAHREQIEILFRVEGIGTAQLAQKGVGESLDVVGPLGQPFDLRLFHVKQGEKPGAITPILVAGGVGVPPMVFLGKTLKELGFEPLALIGARGRGELLGVRDFNESQVETRLATEDGSAGLAGRVTQLLEIVLQNHSTTRSQAVVYACGPWPMLRAVAGVAATFGVPCQVSLEENMPCGIGACNGCVVAMKRGGEGQRNESALSSGEDYGRYQRVCVTGPALWASEIDWEAR